MKKKLLAWFSNSKAGELIYWIFEPIIRERDKVFVKNLWGYDPDDL